MKKITLVFILCFGVFFYSFSSKKENTQISTSTSNIVKSLVQTTDYMKLQVNSPMKLAEYTADKNDKSCLIKSISKDIIFIPNKGQIIDTEGKLRPDILYKAELNGVDLYLTKKGMSFVFYKYEDAPKNLAAGNKEMDRFHDPIKDNPVRDKKVKMYRMDLDIVGMNTNVRTLNKEQTVEYFNYYYAHCPDGITKVYGYRKVIFENVYNNIDLVYYINEKGLKYDFIVKPGGDVADIKLKYRNEDEVYITEEGKIRALNPFGELETDVLLTYQNDREVETDVLLTYQNGREVESYYKKEPDGTISINTGEYDKTKDLIIDPYIGATYYGGNGSDWGQSITTDEDDNILVMGGTGSSNFPVLNPGGGTYFQGTHSGGYDIFVIKFNSNGVRQWATYYGGNINDEGFSLATDGNNNILVTGYATSTNFPLQNPGGNAYFQDTIGGEYYDAFILKFSSTGIRQWATYYGGDSKDYGHSIISDGNNNIIVTGRTKSTIFPLQNPGGGAYHQDTNGGGYDSFILKFDSGGVRQWATFFGGYYDDWGFYSTSDDYNNILVSVWTRSADLFTQNPGGGAFFQGTNGGDWDIFILKLNSNCVSQWATYYGGSGSDKGYLISTDGYNNILLTGETKSSNFPTHNPGGGAFFQGFRGWDAFILKFNSNSVRQWATYCGGNGGDIGYSITSDEANNILLTGMTGSTDFPVHDPGGGAFFQGMLTNLAPDAFIMKFNSSGIRLWGTYYGANGYGYAYSIASDGSNNILVTGWTEGTNLPVFNPGGGAYHQSTMAGQYDAYILGFRPSGAISINILSSSIPEDYSLHQNYPNPFNPTTNIKFDIRESSFTKLIIYDLLGREVATLVNEKLSAGSYEVNWNGSGFPSGVYFYKLVTMPDGRQADGFVDVKKMLIIK